MERFHGIDRHKSCSTISVNRNGDTTIIKNLGPAPAIFQIIHGKLERTKKPCKFAERLLAPELVQDTTEAHRSSCPAARKKNSGSSGNISLTPRQTDACRF